MLLALDVHKAQTTNAIQQCLKKDCKTEPIFVPAGTTSLVQPVDFVFNAPFKAAVEREAAKHLQENLNSYIEREESMLVSAGSFLASGLVLPGRS